MKYILTGKEMKLWEQKLMEKYKMPSVLLMERAALAVVKELEGRDYDLRRVLVVCGAGNNGGDGLAVARILKNRNVLAEVCMAASLEKLSADARQQMEMYQAIGGNFVTLPVWDEYTVIVDAIFGIGCNREITGLAEQLIRGINSAACKKVAIDIPSGVSADTGKICGIAVRADATVTFFMKKLGTLLYPGADCCGKIVLDSLAMPLDLTEECTRITYEKEDLLKLPKRTADTHKGSYGRVLVIAGSAQICGAAYLAAAAAYRTGAGLVKVYTAEQNKTSLQMLLPEALYSVYREEDWSEEELEEAVKWADTVVVGPGIGCGFTAEKILRKLFQCSKVPMVVDADGINLLAMHKEELEKKKAPLILTPHILEMSRLTGTGRKIIKETLIETAQRFADAHSVTVVLKDARTIVAQNGEAVYVNTSGNSGMATGGSGDVLAGILGGLLAQGMDEIQAARLGVYLHGLAGDAAADKKGAYSMLASDILEGIAEVTGV